MEHAGCSCLRGRTWPYQVRPNAKLRAVGSHRWVLSRGVIMASFTFTDYLGFWLLCGAQNRQGKTGARDSCVVVQGREMLAESWLGPRGDGRKHGLGGDFGAKSLGLGD